MNIEFWVEHHQAPLFGVALLLSIIGSSKQIRTILIAVPKGVKAVRKAYRYTALSLLEEYRENPNALLLDIIRRCTFLIFIGCLLGLIGGASLKIPSPEKQNQVSYSVLWMAVQIGTIEIELFMILMTGVASAGITAYLLWWYRDADSRIDKLHRLINEDREKSEAVAIKKTNRKVNKSLGYG